MIWVYRYKFQTFKNRSTIPNDIITYQYNFFPPELTYLMARCLYWLHYIEPSPNDLNVSPILIESSFGTCCAVRKHTHNDRGFIEFLPGVIF